MALEQASSTQASSTPSKVAVFWDIINCFPLQSTFTSTTVIKKLQHLARAQGTLGSFRAYAGGFSELPLESQRELRSALQKEGVALTTYSRPEPINIERLISVDVFAHALDNPRATLILAVANPSAFFYSISALRNRDYRVVLIVPPNDAGTSKDRADLVLGWDEALNENWELVALERGNELRRCEGGAREEQVDSRVGRRGSEESRDQVEGASAASTFAPFERTNGLAHSPSTGSSVVRTQASSSPFLASEPSLRSHERESAMHEGNAFGITGLQQALADAWPQEAASMHALNAGSLPAAGRAAINDEDDEWESAARPEHESSWISPHMPGAAPSSDLWPSSPPELRTAHKGEWGFELITSPPPSLASPSLAPPSLAPPSLAFPRLPSTSLPPSTPAPPLGGSYASTLVPKPHQPLRGGITPSGAHDPTNALPSSNIRRTRTVPRAFAPLVEVLRERLAQGESRPARGLIGTDLKEGNPAIYSLLGPGLVDFKSYTAAAQKIGIVKLGRADFQGGEWIQLTDTYRS